MTLEDILKTIESVLGTAKEDLWDRPDELVREQYQRMEESIGKAKMTLCLNIFFIPSFVSGFVSGFSGITHPMPITIYSMLTGATTFISLPFYYMGDNNRTIESETRTEKKNMYMAKKYARDIRFPLLLGTAASLYYPVFENIHHLSHSLVGFGCVSVLYLLTKTQRSSKKIPSGSERMMQ